MRNCLAPANPCVIVAKVYLARPRGWEGFLVKCIFSLFAYTQWLDKISGFQPDILPYPSHNSFRIGFLLWSNYSVSLENHDFECLSHTFSYCNNVILHSKSIHWMCLPIHIFPCQYVVELWLVYCLWMPAITQSDPLLVPSMVIVYSTLVLLNVGICIQP